MITVTQFSLRQLLSRWCDDVNPAAGAPIQSFVSSLRRHVLEKGASLLRPGDVCRSHTFVTRGCLRVSVPDSDGADRILYFAPAGWWVADIDSGATPRAGFAIEAVESSDLLVVGKAALEQLRLELSGFESVFNEWRASALAATERRLVSSLRKTALQRYADFVHEYSTAADRIPQYQIAAYIGVTPEFLSALRRRRKKKKSSA